jgi:enoyl-[acyl-carrier protein] reductase I
MKPLVDLTGKRGLVIGIANAQSIAAGCAQAFHDCGARLAVSNGVQKGPPIGVEEGPPFRII